MKLQQKISKSINEKMVGKTIDCIIEAIAQDGAIVGRTYKDAPEVDGLIYIDSEEMLTPGDIVSVKVVAANEYDLFGEIG